MILPVLVVISLTAIVVFLAKTANIRSQLAHCGNDDKHQQCNIAQILGKADQSLIYLRLRHTFADQLGNDLCDPASCNKDYDRPDNLQPVGSDVNSKKPNLT